MDPCPRSLRIAVVLWSRDQNRHLRVKSFFPYWFQRDFFWIRIWENFLEMFVFSVRRMRDKEQSQTWSLRNFFSSFLEGEFQNFTELFLFRSLRSFYFFPLFFPRTWTCKWIQGRRKKRKGSCSGKVSINQIALACREPDQNKQTNIELLSINNDAE